MDLNSIFKLFVEMVLCQYTIFFFSLFFKKNRKEVQKRNEELDRLRKKPIKTIAEQKKFIELRYPTTKFKLDKLFIFKTLAYASVFYGYYILLNPIYISLWISLAIIFLSPLAISFLLRKFKLQQDNTLVDMFTKSK